MKTETKVVNVNACKKLTLRDFKKVCYVAEALNYNRQIDYAEFAARLIENLQSTKGLVARGELSAVVLQGMMLHNNFENVKTVRCLAMYGLDDFVAIDVTVEVFNELSDVTAPMMHTSTTLQNMYIDAVQRAEKLLVA